MNRLIRAEFYRLCHSGMYIRILVMLFGVMLFFPLLLDFEILDKTLAENMENFLMGTMVCVMVFSVVVAFFVSLGYTKKTAYYEVMAGSKIWHIIGSKLVTEGLLLGVVSVFATIGFGIVVVAKSGIGEIDNLGLRLGMLFIVCLHMTMVGTLMGAVVKNIAACLLAYARFVIVDMPIAVIVLPILYKKGMLGETLYQRLSQCMINTQISAVYGSAELTMEAVLMCLVSFFAEVAVWYVLAYLTMKKKWYK